MKIVQIVPSLEERHGGPSKSVLELSRALSRAGHETELLTTHPSYGDSEKDGELRVSIFHRDWPQKLCRSAGLKSRLKSADASVIHHHALWLRTLQYAKDAAKRKKIPLVVSPRGMMSEWAWNHHRGLKRLSNLLVHPGALASAAGWHVTSEEEALDVRARGFNQPICVAPNGVSEPLVADMAKAVQYWHERWPASSQKRVALFYSRFHRKKRVLELIDLWLKHSNPDWVLLLVGIPQDYKASMLEEYALRSGGVGRIAAFDGGGRPPPYPIASLFLLPSHNENFGLAIAEALANGVPALVTDATPWSELNHHGGWCVPWKDYPEALMAATAESPESLQIKGAGAKAWVLSEYSWERPAAILNDFYQQLAQT